MFCCSFPCQLGGLLDVVAPHPLAVRVEHQLDPKPVADRPAQQRLVERYHHGVAPGARWRHGVGCSRRTAPPRLGVGAALRRSRRTRTRALEERPLVGAVEGDAVKLARGDVGVAPKGVHPVNDVHHPRVRAPASVRVCMRTPVCRAPRELDPRHAAHTALEHLPLVPVQRRATMNERRANSMALAHLHVVRCTPMGRTCRCAKQLKEITLTLDALVARVG